MPRVKHTLTIAEKRKKRVRAKLWGTHERPRVCVTRTNKYCYVQVINDQTGLTLLSVNDVSLQKEKTEKEALTKTQSAAQIAESLAAQMKKAKIQAAVFDRGQYKYHGRVKAVAEALRNNGIKV